MAARHREPLPCRLVAKDTYGVRTACCTILAALCEVAHDLDESSDAYCIRHHPHDEEVTFHIDQRALDACLAELRARLREFSIAPGESVLYCSVACPSFWHASMLRRALYSHIEVLACTSVRIIRNNSRFEDALIAHRCGQIALQSDAPEASGIVSVEGRDALGEDIRFAGGARVAPCDLKAPIVALEAAEAFEAELVCSRGTPLTHAKFHSVAAPSYWADVRLARPPSADEAALLAAEYSLGPDWKCSRRDGRPCRAEVLEEAVPGMKTILGPGVTVGVESLGQYTAIGCALRAVEALEAEAAALAEAISACDRTGEPAEAAHAATEQAAAAAAAAAAGSRP